MTSAVHRWAVVLAVVLFASTAVAADDVVARTDSRRVALGEDMPETDWARVPRATPRSAPDPLFDEDFSFDDHPLVSDPFEDTNRRVLGFNQELHEWVFSPIERAYRFAVPEAARRGVRRMFRNLNSPSILANDILQLRFRDAGETLGRFLLNSTVGAGGVFDVAVEAGWEYHDADFGQTLANVGVGSGPYLMVPVFGPNTVRDGFGDLVDIMFQPLTYLLGPAPNIVIGTSRGFTLLEEKSGAMRALEESSVDYYAALRSAYVQNRNAMLEGAGDDDEFVVAPSDAAH